MRLSDIQLKTLIDIHDRLPIAASNRTITSLLNKGLIDRDWELTELGYEVIKETEFRDSEADLINASFYLGEQIVENPGNLIFLGLGTALAAFLKSRRG